MAVLSRLSRHAIPGQRRCAWKALVVLYCRVVEKKTGSRLYRNKPPAILREKSESHYYARVMEIQLGVIQKERKKERCMWELERNGDKECTIL